MQFIPQNYGTPTITVQAVDDSGLPLNSKTATNFPTMAYQIVGANATNTFSLTDLASATASYTSGGVIFLGGTWGKYRIDLPTNSVTTAASFVTVGGETSGFHVLASDIGVGFFDASGVVTANTTKIGGTTQTARDLGASVLLSAGTGTGQLDFTSGVVKGNLVQILSTVLTETAGYLAAGFKSFFNVLSGTLTIGGTNQSGDNYTRLGAPAGASVSADIAQIEANLLAGNSNAYSAANGSSLQTQLQAGNTNTLTVNSNVLAGNSNNYTATSGAALLTQLQSGNTNTLTVNSNVLAGNTAQYTAASGATLSSNVLAGNSNNFTSAAGATLSSNVLAGNSNNFTATSGATMQTAVTAIKTNTDQLHFTGTNVYAAISGTVTADVPVLDAMVSGGVYTVAALANAPGGGLGAGANKITVNVTSSIGGAILAAQVAWYQGYTPANYGTTDINGNTGLFGLSTGDYTLVVTAGVAYTGTTIAETINSSQTINVTLTPSGTVAPSTQPGQLNAYVYCYDGQANLKTGVTVTFTLVKILTPIAGQSPSTLPFTATSDSNGLLQVTLNQMSEYQWNKGGQTGNFKTSTQNPMPLAGIIGPA